MSKRKGEEYLTTYTYRGISVDIYVDEPGQQFYFYYHDKAVGCGAFNPDYEDVVRYFVDADLDKKAA